MAARSPALIVAALATAAVAGAPVQFGARAGPVVGQRYTEEADWRSAGTIVAKVAGVKVRDRAVDDRTRYRCDVGVLGVQGPRSSTIEVRCLEASTIESGERAAYELVGLTLKGEGVGKARSFTREDGKRLKKADRDFLEGNFRDREADQPDPMDLLLPKGPVAPGDHWSIPLDAIGATLGTERIRLEPEACHTDVRFERVVQRDGVELAQLAFRAHLEPSWLRDGEYQLASMDLSGTAEIPLQGDSPARGLQMELALRYLGTFRRGPVTADLDLDLRWTGQESRRPAPP